MRTLSTRGFGRREVFNPPLVKPAVPVVQPDIQTPVAEGTLDDNIRFSVIVDVRGGYRQSGFRRLECELAVVAARQMKFDAIAALTSKLAGLRKQSSIQLLIAIEIRYGKHLPDGSRQLQ